MKTNLPLSKMLVAIAGIAALGAAAPGHAQQVVEEIIVEGYPGKLPDNVRRAATAVSYADLDLSTREGRSELRQRVKLTARYLCEKLGETDRSSGVVPSCIDQSVRSTMRRVGTVEENAIPRGSAWVPPPRWAAPYPAAWVEETTYTQTYPAPTDPATQTYETQSNPPRPASTQYCGPPSEPYVEY